MARIIVRNGEGPRPVEKTALPAGDQVYLCRCGLSKNGTFCDGSHKSVRGEDTKRVYLYELIDGTYVRRDITDSVSGILPTSTG